MKKIGILLTLLLFAGCFGAMSSTVQAKESTIETGVYIGAVDVSGMTTEEAEKAVEDYVETRKEIKINLKTVNDNVVTVTAGDLGLEWDDSDVVQEAEEIGKQGNIVQRFLAVQKLKDTSQVYALNYTFDDDAITSILSDDCVQFDQETVNATLTGTDGNFTVVEGQTGYTLNIENSVSTIENYLSNNWDGEEATIQLDIDEEQPEGDAETLSKVKDLLGTFTTSYKTSSSARSENVANGCALINGRTLYPGEQLSVLDCITPFTAENGYSLAGSYLNGQVVESFGGGICQVSTTLYNAVLRAELQVDERSNHSMIVGYVDPSDDAAIAESSGKDLKFTNNLDYPIYIEGITSNKTITFNIYGVETRAANRTVEFESEVLQTIVPTTDTIVQDATQPIGYIDVTQSVHIGYKAKLWKIVKVDGEQVSKEQVNQSSYAAVPQIVTVGTATEDANAESQLQAAIATASLDQVKAVISALTTPAVDESTVQADGSATTEDGSVVSTDGSVAQADGTTTDGAVNG